MWPLSLDGLFLEVWNNSVVLTWSFGPALGQPPSELGFFQLILAVVSQPRLPPLAVRRSSHFPRNELQHVQLLHLCYPQLFVVLQRYDSLNLLWLKHLN